MAQATLDALFFDTLRDVYYAERCCQKNPRRPSSVALFLFDRLLFGKMINVPWLNAK